MVHTKRARRQTSAHRPSFNDAFIDELRDLYGAEREFLRLLREMVKEAHDPAVRGVLTAQMLGTDSQIGRLAHIFGMLGVKTGGRQSDSAAGLAEDIRSVVEQAFDDATLDAYLIACALRIKLHTLGAYRTLLAWSSALGRVQVARDFQVCVDQELGADLRLAALMDSGLLSLAAPPSVACGEGADDEHVDGPLGPARGEDGDDLEAHFV